MNGPFETGRVPVPRDRFPDLGPNAYCLTMEGDSMRPRFAAGDRLVIDPSRIPKDGDFVVLWPSPRIVEHSTAAPGSFHVIVGSFTPDCEESGAAASSKESTRREELGKKMDDNRIVGREGYIIAKALAYAIATIDALPENKREVSDRDDMVALLIERVPNPAERERLCKGRRNSHRPFARYHRLEDRLI